MPSALQFQSRADSALEMSLRPENRGMQKTYIKLWAHWREELERAQHIQVGAH